MGVDVAHLVEEAAGDTNDQVVDDGADGAEGSDTLTGTVVQLDRDGAGLGATEGNGNVGQVLDENAAGTLDGHNTRLNVNLHCREKSTDQPRFWVFRFASNVVVMSSTAKRRRRHPGLFFQGSR